MPIAFQDVRQAARRQDLARVAARPSAGRLVRNGTPTSGDLVIAARLAEAPKTRALALGGMITGYDLDAWLVLPRGVVRPEPQKDLLEAVDLDGVYQNFTIAAVTPMIGYGCYHLALKSRRSAPTRPAPPVRLPPN